MFNFKIYVGNDGPEPEEVEIKPANPKLVGQVKEQVEKKAGGITDMATISKSTVIGAGGWEVEVIHVHSTS